MASSVGAYTGGTVPPSGGSQPEDTDELFTDAVTVKSGLWVAYLATNKEYSLIEFINDIRALYPGANIIEVHQSDISTAKSYSLREKVHLTTYYVVKDERNSRSYVLLERANLTPYNVKTIVVKSRAIACTRPDHGSLYGEDEDDDVWTRGLNNVSSTIITDNGWRRRGRGAALRRSIMARNGEGDDSFTDTVMMYESMGISVTVKVGGVETGKTLKEWLKDTEDYINQNCQQFMVIRNMLDFFNTQPEESVETKTNADLKNVEPERVSMPVGDTNIMIAGAKLSDDQKTVQSIYPLHIIREIPQNTLNGLRTYKYATAKLPKELRTDLLSRVSFGLTTYKDDIYYFQSLISRSVVPSAETIINSNDIKTAQGNVSFDLDKDVKVDTAHFYRLHSTAISMNVNKRNTRGIPPLMHRCMSDIICYTMDDADDNGYVTIDLTRNSPFKDNEESYNTPYTMASIIAKFTRGESLEYAEGNVLYYLRPIHISKVSVDHNDKFGGTYYPYALVSGSETNGYDTCKIQIYQCYTPAEDQGFKLHLPVLRDGDDEYIKSIIDNMKESVKSVPSLVTDYGVRILPAEELAFDNLSEEGTPIPNRDPCHIWNAGENMTEFEKWRDKDEPRDIKIQLDKEEDKNAIIVHYGLTFDVTGSVFGLPDPSEDISIDFFTNIDTYNKFIDALGTYTQGGRFFMFSMPPYIMAHGNPDAIIVLVIDSLSPNEAQSFGYDDDTIITAHMYTSLDLKDYYNPPDPPAPDDDIEQIEPLNTGSIETEGTESKDMEPLLINWQFEYPLSIVGNPFPLTAKVIRDIFSVGDTGKANKIKSNRAIQFSLSEASAATTDNKAFYRYLNDMILNYKLDADDGGWGDNALSSNLIDSRWYAGQYKPPLASKTQSIRRKRRVRTNPGLLVL